MMGLVERSPCSFAFLCVLSMAAVRFQGERAFVIYMYVCMYVCMYVYISSEREMNAPLPAQTRKETYIMRIYA